MTSAPRTDRRAARGNPIVVTRVIFGAFLLGAIAVTALAIAIAPAPVILNLPLVAHTSGLLAGYAVTVLVLLMSRAPLLEHNIGADRMSRWHAAIGKLTIMLIVVHAIAATLGWAQAQMLSIVASTDQVLRMPGLIAATVSTFVFLVIGASSARAARRRMPYETWHAIHTLTYLAIALAFAHELAGPDLAGHPAIQICWSLLYTLSFALLVRYRLLTPVLQAVRHRLRVEAVVFEDRRVVTLVIRGRHLDELKAVSGQFFRWRFLAGRSWLAAHPFSLSAPPTNGELRVTVKGVGSGTRALKSIRPGTMVLAEGPYGAMTELRRTRDDVLLIAGGVGITPMRSLFETLDSADGRVTLLYRVPEASDILFRPELESIAVSRRLELIYWVGRSSAPGNAMTAANLLHRVPDAASRDVYICAGPALTSAARAALRDLGLPRRNLHTEEFAF